MIDEFLENYDRRCYRKDEFRPVKWATSLSISFIDLKFIKFSRA